MCFSRIRYESMAVTAPFHNSSTSVEAALVGVGKCHIVKVIEHCRTCLHSPISFPIAEVDS